ncbi:small membrane protein YohP [Ectopseudomonas mendocina]
MFVALAPDRRCCGLRKKLNAGGRFAVTTPESRKRRVSMLKFLGGTVGIIFIIGLIVVIGLLKLIF